MPPGTSCDLLHCLVPRAGASTKVTRAACVRSSRALPGPPRRPAARSVAEVADRLVELRAVLRRVVPTAGVGDQTLTAFAPGKGHGRSDQSHPPHTHVPTFPCVVSGKPSRGATR